MNSEEIKAAVDRGFMLLTPEQRAKVNLATLDMADGFNCILGQIYGIYSNGVELLLNVEFNTYECDVVAEFYGFYVDGRYRAFSVYELLKCEWIRRLEIERGISTMEVQAFSAALG
jgi:hypothetical protein